MNTRRQFIKHGYGLLAGILGGAVLWQGCGQGQSGSSDKSATTKKEYDPCDLSALSEQDHKHRKGLGYVDKTPISEKYCENCKLYVPPSKNKGKCASCPLFKGPVQPEGYCTYWVPAES